MGDLNAKVGNNNNNREDVMEKFGVGVMNGNRERGYVTSVMQMDSS